MKKLKYMVVMVMVSILCLTPICPVLAAEKADESIAMLNNATETDAEVISNEKEQENPSEEKNLEQQEDSLEHAEEEVENADFEDTSASNESIELSEQTDSEPQDNGQESASSSTGLEEDTEHLILEKGVTEELSESEQVVESGKAVSNGVANEDVAQAIWTAGNKTLSFFYGPQYTEGDIFNGLSITNVWSGEEVCSSGNGFPLWNATIKDIVTTVSFDESFLQVMPTSTYGWFRYCNKIENINNLAFLNTSNVTNMAFMFTYCSQLTNLDVSSFNTSNVTSMASMFEGCQLITNLDLSSFNTSNVTDMSCMFRDCYQLTNLDVSSFNTSNVTKMFSMFSYCRQLTNLDIGSFNTSNVTDMSGMFDNCRKLSSLDLNNFDVSNVKNMNGMFSDCASFIELDLKGFDTSKVTAMGGMFSGCKKLKRVDVSSFDTSNVYTLGGLFKDCYSLEAVDITGFNTSNVLSFASMFEECHSLKHIDLSNLDTSHIDFIGAVPSLKSMFLGCESLTELDVSSFTVYKKTDRRFMFNNCKKLETIYCADSTVDWSAYSGTNVTGNMFYNCDSLVGKYGDITVPFNSFYISEYRAKSASLGGYFTPKENNSQIVEPNSLVITEGPISLNTGDMTVISAVYYNENCDSDEIEGQLHWSYTSDDGGEVSLRRSSESFLGYLCEVSGVNTGQCTVTASTDSGLTASVVIDVVPKPEEPKETISITGTEEHLSGSNNYVLNDNQNGVIDFNAPITSEVTINTGSTYQAGRIFIKNNGVLHVGGTLHVSEIHIEAGGVLEISGRVFAGTIIANGGNWLVKNGGILRGSGIVEALDVEFKDYSTCEMTGQLIAKNNFIYSSNKESGSFCGTLFAGGNMDIGKNFKSAGDALTTVIYGDTSGRSFSFHKKCNLGKVFAQNSESYSNVCMSVNNRTSVHQYTSLTPRDHDTWFYGIGNVLFEQEVDGDWASGQGAYYVNLANEQNNAVSISSLSDNTERDFVEKLAVAWIGSIEAQIDRGFMTTSTGTYELYFIMNKKEYVLKYELQGYGSFANLGFLYFGQAGDENLAPIGITSAASIENFKAQAATYLAESYVQEYYKYVTGFKWRTEASMKKKLQQMGTKAVIKYFQKNLEKNLFGTLAVTKGPEYKQLEKTFSISRMTLDGDIKGLWKFAIKEITSQSAKQKTAQLSLPEEATETNNDAETTRNAVTDEITDEYLKRALISALGDDGTGNPDFTNQGEITSLNLSGKYIQSLNGIQNFTNIQTLVLSYNEISDLTPLAEMESLKNLYINGQNIEDLTPLSGLSGLVMLDASDNSISSVAPLSGLTSLNRLVISDNPVESLDGLESLVNLQVLEAESISLDDGDLSALANASSLSELYMDDSGLQSIDELNVSSVRILSIAGNEVSSLGCISDAENLERLNAPDNLISSIPSLANCNALKEIDLSGNILEDLSGLESANSVETLSLSDCELLTGDIQPISGMDSLRDLDLSWNPMIDDLSPLYTIENLNSIDASKTDIIVFNNPVIIDSHEISIQADGISLAKTEFDEYTFAGNAVEPNIVIECDDRNLVEDVDFTVSYSDNLAPGTATATVTGTGRCVGTLSIDYLISSIAIVVQPQDVEAANGETAEFHIEVSGSGIAYQWQVSSTGITWKNCTGAGYNTDTFSFTMKEKFAGRQYRCIVTTDNTTLTSDAATLSLKQSDGIIEQPADAAASVGETVSFHVGFTGDAPTYQWKVSSNGTTWKNCTGPGYNTDTFSFTMKEKFAGRQYKCVVTCGGVAYTSNAATLSLDDSLKITSQPEDVTVATGENASFHVEASGENLSYQWQVSSTGTTWKNCTGAGYNTDTFSFTTKRSYSGRKYRCKVSDGTDTAISNSAELTVAN